MTKEKQLEIVSGLLEKDPKQPMNEDEIRVFLAFKKSQDKLIKTMRIKQRLLPYLQDQSEMGKMIREEKQKTLTDLLESHMRILLRLLNNS